MKSKLIIGKILTSLLFLLLVSNFTAVGFTSYERQATDHPAPDDDKSFYFWNDEDAGTLDVDFNPQKDGLEEGLELFTCWYVVPSEFKFSVAAEPVEEVRRYSYDPPVFYQDIPVWIFTRKILL